MKIENIPSFLSVVHPYILAFGFWRRRISVAAGAENFSPRDECGHLMRGKPTRLNEESCHTALAYFLLITARKYGITVKMDV